MRLLQFPVLCGVFLAFLTAAVFAQSPPLQQLHDALHLSAGQEAGWNSYVQALAIAPEEAARRRDFAQRMAQLTAPQRVDLSVQMMQADLKAMQRRGAALKTFYATLTPQQQQIFDRDTLQPPPGAEGGGMR